MVVGSVVVVGSDVVVAASVVVVAGALDVVVVAGGGFVNGNVTSAATTLRLSEGCRVPVAATRSRRGHAILEEDAALGWLGR